MEIERNLRVFNDFLRRIDLINLITVKNSNEKYKKSLNTEFTTKNQTFPKKSVENDGVTMVLTILYIHVINS
jgi:hypothetical protein